MRRSRSEYGAKEWKGICVSWAAVRTLLVRGGAVASDLCSRSCSPPAFCRPNCFPGDKNGLLLPLELL